MGRGYTQYSYTSCDLPDEWSIRSAYLDYVLDDGKLLHVDQADFYCRKCDRFTVGERIETVAELQHQIDQIENHPNSRERKIAEFLGPVSKRIAELLLRVEWRKRRKSPSKCLECGSTEVLAIPEEEEFFHPGNGEPMKVSGRGLVSMAAWHATYTPEGDQIDSFED